MRLFIAINFSDTTRARLMALRDELRKKSSGGRFSAPENFHLTLAFLGECDSRQKNMAQAAMDSVNVIPLTVTIDRLGRYRGEGGDLWWAGVRDNENLSLLHSELTEKLVSSGFNLEKRKYSPHVTLGRQVATKELPREIEPFSETFSAIELMKSERINGKLTYTAIYINANQE